MDILIDVDMYWYLTTCKMNSMLSKPINGLAKVQNKNVGSVLCWSFITRNKNDNLPVINTTQNSLVFLKPTHGIYNLQKPMWITLNKWCRMKNTDIAYIFILYEFP